jgi:hypothetical protein
MENDFSRIIHVEKVSVQPAFLFLFSRAPYMCCQDKTRQCARWKSAGFKNSRRKEINF